MIPWRVAAATTLASALLTAGWARAETFPQALVSRSASDFRYSVNNLEADAEDIFTSPLHIGDLIAEDGLLRRPVFYATVFGIGAVFGGAFALDETVRSRLKGTSRGTADLVQSSGNAFVVASSGALYAYGFLADDQKAREDVLTGVEGLGVASLMTTGFQQGFGRLRPDAGRGHRQFFKRGTSFPSGATTPVFALAASTSEYFENAWYAALPEYAGALTVGFGRITKDRHWLSDVAGSAIVGVATTELFLHLHNAHAAEPSRLRIFPVVARESSGLELAFSW